MRTPLPITGYVGRAIAAIGAVMMIASLFPKAYSSSLSFWAFYRRMDVVILVVAVAVLLLLLVSFRILGELSLFAVGVIGGFGIGFFFLSELIENGSTTAAAGEYLAFLGSAAVLIGASVALVPALASRAGDWQDFAFVPSETATSPTVSPAGWYADPSGQVRLRYWDGQNWTEQTQQ
jgi:hypothetical protein